MARWTTANAEEGLGGVLSPLTWSFYGSRIEAGTRAAWASLGALRPAERKVQADIDERYYTAVHGRMAINVDVFSRCADRMPGASGAALEMQLFGEAGDADPEAGAWRRYPVVALLAPGAMIRATRGLRQNAPAVHRWWQQTVSQPERLSDESQARATMQQAERWFATIVHDHLLTTMIAQGVYERLAAIASSAGLPGCEQDVIVARGGTDETHIARDLWQLSRSQLEIDTFLERHGYHGPQEGILDSRSWREDRALVVELAERYRSLADDASPVERQRRRDAAAERARRELTVAVSRPMRPVLPLVFSLAQTAPEMRELGRSLLLRVVDVARVLGRVQGQQLAADGRLEDPADVYMLTLEELLGSWSPTLPERILRRRDNDRLFKESNLPLRWQGAPVPIPVREPARQATAPTTLHGLGVSAGVTEGAVTVITDPATQDFPPGDVLVCRTTDPSWVSLMMLASAIVIDVGSAMSHGAIVARELGLPAVAGAADATTLLRDGDRVRVDGRTGVVEVLTRPAPAGAA